MKVYELLADPASWTKGEFARNANGYPVLSRSNEACCWCLAGAVNVCYENNLEIRDMLKTRLGTYISIWNDAPERTHADVINLCRELDI